MGKDEDSKLTRVVHILFPFHIQEKVPFRASFLLAWAMSGIILTIIAGISIATGPKANGIGFDRLLVGGFNAVVVVVILGLMGLFLEALIQYGLDFSRVRHTGWRWWFYPLTSYLWIGWLLVIFIFGLIGLSLGMSGIGSGGGGGDDSPGFDWDQYYRDIAEALLKDFLAKYRRALEQIDEELERQKNQGDDSSKPEREVVRKVLKFDASKYGNRLEDLLSRNEIEVLLRVILRILGVEIG